MSILTTLLGPVSQLAGTWMQQRGAEKQAKHEAKMQVIRNGAEWETNMANASASSWKDEFWTVVLAIPVFMVGYAIAMNDTAIIDRVAMGFEALNALPQWYQYLLFLAVSASFGIRGADKLMKLRK